MEIYKPRPTKKQNPKSTTTALKRGQLDLTKVSQAIGSKENGTKKAAKLLLALGVKEAAETLKHLDPSEVEAIMREITHIDQIDNQEKESLLREFSERVREENTHLRGGVHEARKFLEASLGSNASEEIMRRINHRDLYEDFAFLETIEPQLLASTLCQEHSQVVAVALSYMKPKIAAQIMQYLPENFRSEVALRIAKAEKINPESIQRVASVLRTKFEKPSSENYSEIDGIQSLAYILNHMERNHENDILSSLGKQTPDMVEKVKEHLYTFEELAILSNQEIRLLISHLDDNEILAIALRGAPTDLRLHFFNSMSQNRASDIIDEMEYHSPVPVREVNEARSYIVNVARGLDEAGKIRIKKDNEEEYI